MAFAAAAAAQPAFAPNVSASIPLTMKAVSYSAFADKSKSFEEECKRLIRIEENVPVPTPSDSDLLVKVHAASINPVDWKIFRGDMYMLLRRPTIPGFDVAGTVVKVGSKVASSDRRFQVGDKVYGKLPAGLGSMRGTFAEYVAISGDAVAMKPASLTFAQAASIPLAALTSYQALTEQAGMKMGDSVLVLGGSGGTGLFGVEIARGLRAGRVAATASPTNFALVQSAGASDVYDYHGAWWNEIKEEKFDIVYDTVGGAANWENAKKVLSPKGKFVTTIGDYHGTNGALDIARNLALMMVRKTMSLFGRQPAYNMVLTKSAGKQLEDLGRLVDTGAMRPNIDSQFAFDQAADLFVHSYNGHVKGKAVLAVDTHANEA